MTVTTTVNRVDCPGNGSATSFSFSPVVIQSASQLVVTLRDPSGNQTTLVQGSGNTNYSLNVGGFPGTGSITYPATGSVGGTTLPPGWTLSLSRIVPLLQDTSLGNNAAFFSAVIESAFDYLVMIAQQLQEQLDRTIQAGVTDPDFPLTLPTSVQRANQMLGFDGSGNPIAAQPGSALVSTPMQPIVDSATLAAAQLLFTGFNPISTATTFFVAKTGSDSNPGTSGSPWLTIQHAINTVTSRAYLQDALVTINVGTGTYTEQLQLLNFVGSYQRQGLATSTGILLQGQPATPGNVIISNNAGGTFCVTAAGLTTNWIIDGFQLLNPSGSLILADWGSTLSLGNIQYNTCAQNMIQAQYHSRVELMRGATQSIIGNCAGAFASANACSIILAQGASGTNCNINIAAGLSIGAGSSATNMSFVDLSAAVFSGSVITGVAFGATSSVVSQFNDNIFPATIKGSQQGIRIPAGGAIVYNVTTSGNDTSGRGTSSAPFATIQAAINYALTQMDTLGGNITINVGTGTFTSPAVASYNPVGGGLISITGQGTAATLLSCGSDCITATNGAIVAVSNMALASTGNCLRAVNGGRITVNGPIAFGLCAGALLRADLGGNISVSSGFAITANAAFAFLATQGGAISFTGSPACTMTGGLTFSSSFANSSDIGLIEASGLTFTSNAATGTRMVCTTNSVIDTGGAGATFFPGNANGSPATGGQYV